MACTVLRGGDDGNIVPLTRPFRRGRRFGTILVDLQTRKVLDVLSDRTADTSAAWMTVHPEIELVSRDRGGDYAAAARRAVPGATQTADRFHLLKNLGEALEGFWHATSLLIGNVR